MGVSEIWTLTFSTTASVYSILCAANSTLNYGYQLLISLKHINWIVYHHCATSIRNKANISKINWYEDCLHFICESASHIGNTYSVMG